MSIRDRMNKNATLTTVAAVVVLIIAVWFVVAQLGPRGQAGAIKRSYFYDLGSGRLFVAGSDQVPPIEAPSGTIDHNGNALPAGVSAYVFACGGCEQNFQGMTAKEVESTGARIAYLEQYTDEAKKRKQSVMKDGRRSGGSLYLMDSGRMLAKPPADANKYPRFYDQSHPSASKMATSISKKCADGTFPEPCLPPQ